MALQTMNLAVGAATEIDVWLNLTNVDLRNPELWRYLETSPGVFDYKKVPFAAPATASDALWSFKLSGATWFALKLYWDAVEPMQPQAVYQAMVTVDDTRNPLATKGAGETNPRILPCMVGPVPPHGGSEMVGIYAD